jgi:MoxR-like ATPase
MATMNPIDQEGTYQLPEAQLDRFLLKIKVDYPTKVEERQILDLMATSSPKLTTEVSTNPEAIKASREVVNDIHVDDRVKDYIVELIYATRHPEGYLDDMKHLIRCGASPRGTINLTLASKALAYLEGRPYVTPQDIKDLVPDVLRHRVLITYEAEAEGITSEAILQRLLERIPVP